MAALQLEKRPAAAQEAPAAPVFPEGMRVMTVDDDRVCLMILEAMLRKHKYHVTTAMDAKTALQMLREKKDGYDLVITDLHMPEMDGFDLLRQIGLEMDLPVIMLSANDEMESVKKGIQYGACDYLVKPVQMEQLKHIWQHVLRRKPKAWNHNNSGNDINADQLRIQAGTAQGEQGAKSTRKNPRKKRNDGHDSDESKDNSSKKPRVSWSVQLHGQFLDAVNQIGIDKAGPKKIFDIMNVDHVSRESVGSHLQKYRIFLKRLAEDPKWKSNNECCDIAERWGMSSMEMFEHFHGDTICRHPSSAAASSSSNNHSTAQTIQPLGMGTVSHGGSMPKDASASATGYEPYAKTLCDMLLEANQGKNSSAKTPNSGLFALLNQSPVQQPAPVNRSSAMMIAPATNLVGALGVGDTSKFPHLVGNYNNTWQTVPSKFPDLVHKYGTSAGPSWAKNVSKINQLASSSQVPMIRNEMQNLMAASNSNTSSSVVGFNQLSPFNNIASNTSSFEMLLNGNFAPGSTSSIGFPNVQTSHSVSFPNLAPGSTSGTSFPNLPTGSFVTPTQQMVNGVSMSFPNLQTCTSVTPTQMVNGASISSKLPNIPVPPGNYITLDQIVNGLKISSTLPNIEADSSVAPTHMLNGGDAVGSLPVQEGTSDQQDLDGQLLNDNDDFRWDDIDDMFDQNLNIDDILNGEWF